MTHIIILGGGISGLATGWFLKKSFGDQISLTIIEKDGRPGGWMESRQLGEFLFEQGPRSCRTKGAGKETLAFIEELGLEKEVIIPCTQAKKRYLFDGKKLESLPKHFWEFPFHPLMKGFLQALKRDWITPKRLDEDESIYTFFSRRIGKDWTERFIDSMVLGIYAGDYKRLSLKSCFPLFDEWEQKQGSLLRGAWGHQPAPYPRSPFIEKMKKHSLFSFQEGMGRLPQALASRLQDNLLLGQTITHVSFEEGKGKVVLASEESLQADLIISTLPTYVFSELLNGYPHLAEKLKALIYADVTILNVGFQQNLLSQEGFGYLIPSRHDLPILGCVWDSSIFLQQNRGEQTRLTFMMGGTQHPEVEAMTEAEILNIGKKALEEHLGIRKEPTLMQIKRAPQAIPQFEVGHANWKEEVEKEIRQQKFPLILSGSAWTGVSINDCIAGARKLANEIIFTYNRST